MSEASKELQDYLRNDWPHELKVVREFLKGGAEVNSVDDDGNSPLLLELRSSFDSSEMLEFLCKKGADLRQKNHRGQTALMLAVLRYTLDDFSAKLIKDGVELDATDNDGNTVVHYAYGNKKILGLLIKAGASLNQVNTKNQTVLHVPSGVFYSIGHDGRPYFGGIEMATLKWLLKQGLDPNARDADGQNSLYAVSRIKSDDPQKAAQILIESGADPAVLDATGTPLSVFHLHDGEPNLAKWFAAKGSHPFDAIIAGDLEKVQAHFTLGVPLPTLRWGLTPLHVAALIGASAEIVGHLIKASPNLDQPDENGNTALSLANSNKRPEMALALINAGASAATQGSESSSDAIKDLVLMANPELLSAMLKGKSGAEIDQLMGPYVKFFRFNQNSLDCLKLLVEKGMSPATIDVDGFLARNGGGSPRHHIWDLSHEDDILFSAILDFIKELIEKGSNPSLSIRAQQLLVQLMHQKVINNAAVNVLTECVSRGMDIRWSPDESLLHWAIELKATALAQSIIERREELIYPTANRESPLRIAVESGHETGVSLLLSAGNKVINDQILDEAIKFCTSEKVMAMLLDYKARSSGSFNAQDPVTLLKIAEDAAKRGMTDILESLIDKGLSLNSLNNGKPIFLTLFGEHASIKNLDWAKQHGADLTLSDSEGRNLLHYLVSTWRDLNSDVFERLLKLGLNINSKDAKGYTPFHLCLGNKDKREKLLEWGADPRVADKPGITTLMTAATQKDPKCIQLMLAAGVSLSDRDNDGNSALAYIGRIWSRRRGSFVESDSLDQEGKECIRLLIEAGLHPDDSGDRRYLNAALAADDIPFAIWLLEQQAQVSNCDLADKKVIAALSKIIRSRPELIASQLDSLDADQRSLLEPLLNKSINAPAEADHNELPNLLREGGWPIPVPPRTQIMVSKVVLPEREDRLVWRDSEQKQILSTRRIRPVPEADRKFEEAIARFEKKPFELNIETLLRASDELFVNYWNTHSVSISPHVLVVKGVYWRWNVIGFRAEDLRYILARYGLPVLPGILNLASKKPGPVMKALSNVDAPACALQVAKFMTGSTSRLARRWLMAYPATAIQGLVTPAVGKAGKDRDAAEAALRYLASQGHRNAIEQLAAQAGAEVTASISEILSVDPRTDYMPKKFPALPSFWDAGIHPRPLFRNGGKALPLSAIETLAHMMSISTYDARTPALDDVIDACEPVSLADFAWSVFDEWRAKGDSASNWMFQALAYLGDDRCAKKLTPIIRDWPASNGQAKALMGLDILAAMGTDVALAQIQSIARKNKYKPIVARADEMLTTIAEARELTADQFEDRLVPTLGLDEQGILVLDYGKRQFTGGVDETLKPRLCDETGATLKELPKPGKDDDKALAKQAGEDWAEFKTELKPVTSLQLLRLENAMIDARRWSGEEFLRLVAGHPLLQQPARSLVWGLFNEKGKLLKSFRILPDGTAQDVKGKSVEIEATSLIGIPHPIGLGEEVTAWKMVFADAKQGQAFAQLVRKTYRRQDDAEMDLFGLQGAIIHSKALKGLKPLGWEMLLPGFADLIEGYYRSFSSGDVEMRIEPGVFIRDLGNNAEEVTLGISVPKTLSEIEFSELMRDLHTLKK